MYGLRYRGALEPTTQAELEGLIAALQEFLLAEHNEDGTHRPAKERGDFVPVGMTAVWWTNTFPAGWLLCDGRAVSRTTYARLFKVIGVTHGAGNGVDTFNLPNCERRVVVGSFSGASVGDTGGTWDHTHGINDEANHNHGGATGSHTLTSLESTDTGLDNADATLSYQAGASTLDVALQGHRHTTVKSGDAPAHTHTIANAGAHDHGGETGAGNQAYIAGHWLIQAGV